MSGAKDLWMIEVERKTYSGQVYTTPYILDASETADVVPCQEGRGSMTYQYRTHQGASRILVEQVDEKGDVLDMRLNFRTDVDYARESGLSNEQIRSMLEDGTVTSGGISDHTQAAKELAGRAVNWTGERTETGYVFVIAQ